MGCRSTKPSVIDLIDAARRAADTELLAKWQPTEEVLCGRVTGAVRTEEWSALQAHPVGSCILKHRAFLEVRVLRGLIQDAAWSNSALPIPRVLALGHSTVVMERCSSTLLISTQANLLGPADILNIGAQLVHGVAVLGRLGWVHLDLAPSNVGLFGTGARLIDLETAQYVAQRPTAVTWNQLGDPHRRWFCSTSQHRREDGSCPRLSVLDELESLGFVLSFCLHAVAGSDWPLNAVDPPRQEEETSEDLYAWLCGLKALEFSICRMKEALMHDASDVPGSEPLRDFFAVLQEERDSADWDRKTGAQSVFLSTECEERLAGALLARSR